MLVVENPAHEKHHPHWQFKLGPSTYSTRDVPDRARTIRRALVAAKTFEIRSPRVFPESVISRMHPYLPYIKEVAAGIVDPKEEIYPDLFPGEGAKITRKIHPLWMGMYCTDAVTPITKGTYEAAKGSAEAALTGAEIVAKGDAREVYCLCRPSGHHAGSRVFGGYCYFNNSALAGELLSKRGKVAILDIDFHHGNGTQEIFAKRADVLTLSIHCDPSIEYPYYTGYAKERGEGRARGSNLNLPLPKTANEKAYLAAVARASRAIRAFGAKHLVIASGFDTQEADPVGGFALPTDSFFKVGAALGAVGLPTVICQEGGYNLRALGDSVRGFLEGFLSTRTVSGARARTTRRMR